MSKDKLTPQQIGRVFLEVLKLQAKINEEVAHQVFDLVEDPKPRVSIDHIKTQLIYLSVYIIYQALFSRFKVVFDEIEKRFTETLKRAIEERTSRELAILQTMEINDALIFYMELHNNTIAKDADESTGLAEFAHRMSVRVLGEGVGDDIRYVAYMTNYYLSTVTGLASVIDEAMQLVRDK